jgi:hypothetical protein
VSLLKGACIVAGALCTFAVLRDVRTNPDVLDLWLAVAAAFFFTLAGML